jgi:hypothetical protein
MRHFAIKRALHLPKAVFRKSMYDSGSVDSFIAQISLFAAKLNSPSAATLPGQCAVYA